MMQRSYEGLIILKGAGTEAEVAQTAAKTEEPVKKLGGVIDGVKPLGRRRLAYRIARQQEGYYHLLEFHLAPEQLDELKRLWQLNETIVRFLVLSRDPAPVPAAVSA